jgi:hypothetical protein
MRSLDNPPAMAATIPLNRGLRYEDPDT